MANKVTEKLSLINMAQCLSYVKTVGKNVGMLLNFGSDVPDFRRILFDRYDVTNEDQAEPVADATNISDAAMQDWIYPELTYKIVGVLYEVHNTLGPGFVHRIYKNFCYVELKW